MADETAVRQSPRLRARRRQHPEELEPVRLKSPRSKSVPKQVPAGRGAPALEQGSELNVEKKADETQGQGKFQKMIKRSVFAVVMMASFALIIWSGHLAVVGFVMVLQTMLFNELIAIRHEKKHDDDIPLFRTLHWSGYAISMFFTYGKSMMLFFNLQWLARYHFYIVFTMYVPFFVAFVLSCAFSGEGKSKESKRKLLQYMFSQISWVVLILFVVVFQMRFVMYMVLEGLFWFLLPTSLVIINDTSAYFVGFAFGKKFIERPLTVLSPNKTWEGFLGGMVCTLCMGWVLAGLLGQYETLTCPHRHHEDAYASCRVNPVFVEAEYTVWPEVLAAAQTLGLSLPSTVVLLPVKLHALLLAFFASIFAPFGGFFASAMKRAYQVSDFGALIPGHGGVMDRMDCQLIMLFCTHVHYRTFVREAELTLDLVWPALLKLTAEDQLDVLNRLTAHLATVAAAAK